MTKNAKDVGKGTRDHCHNCNKVIVLDHPPRREDGYQPRNQLYWYHHDTHLRECDPEKNGHFDPKAVSRNYCGESMSGHSWYTQTCFRPVKDPLRLMCGIHAAAARKREENERKFNEKMELNSYISDELQKIGMRLSEEYGLTVRAEYNFTSGSYTGNIIVDPVELIAFLNDIAGNPEPDEEDDDDDIEWEEV